MSKEKKERNNVEKEDILQAVLIADDFDKIFESFVKDGASVLLPIVNVPAVDYALECLGRCGIQETILFCSSHADVIKQHIGNSKWSQSYSPMSVSVVVSERCLSLGDAMRDLDNKAIIKGAFILMSAFTVSNLRLLNILEFHRKICKKDKGAAMTLVMQDVGASNPVAMETVIAMDATTNRLLYHTKPGTARKLEIPLEYLLEHPNTEILNHVVDTGVAVCSPSVPLLFTDNFDYQTKDDFIRGLLLNEEILAARIYCWEMDAAGYGQTVRDWRSYQRVTTDIIHRYTFPLVPDQPVSFHEQPYSHYRNGVYKQPGVHLGRDVDLAMDIVIGKNSSIGNQVSVVRSVIGRNCQIGNNVNIQDSFIMDNSVIDDESQVRLCVLGQSCRLMSGCHLSKCILRRSVELGPSTRLQDCLVASSPLEDDEGEKLSPMAFVYPLKGGKGSGDGAVDDESDDEDLGVAGIGCWGGLVDPEETPEEEDWGEDTEDEDSEEMHGGSPEQEDTNVFYCEVLDSLQRGYEESLSCDNLILEINSSRYAYNVTLSEVTTLTVKAILNLKGRLQAPHNQTVKPLLVYFLPLLKNYIKSTQAQEECLEVVKEVHEELGPEMASCLHFLYDKDILSEEVILEWYNAMTDLPSLRSKLGRFVEWLEDADEESGSEGSE